MLADVFGKCWLDSATCATAWQKPHLPAQSATRSTPPSLTITGSEALSTNRDNVLGPKLTSGL